ncbi:MAG: RNase adapter RapZ [Synergistales bacterium]|nr:RNase adapter RapZ [Synergistales bacterium]
MSGAGKSATLNILEDQGMFAIDNIPPSLIPQLLNVLSKHRSAVTHGMVAVVDVRGEDLLEDLLSVLGPLREQLESVKLIFLDATDDVLVRRFSETRRRHPLGGQITVLEGVSLERELLSPIRENADIVIDTSDLCLPALREKLINELGYSRSQFSIIFTSFGFKYGIPQDCDFIIDVRFLPNPHYIPDLRPLSGKDRQVRNYISSFPETDGFMDRFCELLDFILPLYFNTGKPQVHFGIGCTGGRHRSVAVAETLCEYLSHPSRHCIVKHRDIEREQVL